MFPLVSIFCDPKSGSIFVPAIAAFEAIFALSITPLSIVKVAALLLTVISPLSPSLKPPPDSFATVPSSFFKNISAVSVLTAGSPKTRSLALGSLQEPCLSLIVLAIEPPP